MKHVDTDVVALLTELLSASLSHGRDEDDFVIGRNGHSALAAPPQPGQRGQLEPRSPNPETDGPRHRQLPSPTTHLTSLSSRAPLSHPPTLLFSDRHVTRAGLKGEGKGKGGTRR
jgi:hypothetical protein